MTEPAAIQVVRRTTILAILVVRWKIHLSRANGQVEFRTLVCLSVTVSKHQVAILARSSQEMSLMLGAHLPTNADETV